VDHRSKARAQDCLTLFLTRKSEIMSYILSSSADDFQTAFARLLDRKQETSANIHAVVHDILETVKDKGDEALYDYTERFDQINLRDQGFGVHKDILHEAYSGLDENTKGALQLAYDRIAFFHEMQKPQDQDYEDHLGVRLGWRWRPMDAAGLYVPGGTASYPSSVLMNAIPAKIAGVERLVMVVPKPKGQLNPLVLAAAHLTGIDEVYTLGGAQAIAALAYGTKSIAPVNVIVGPGNAYVAAAKRQVFGQVGIDMIAGPSEVLIIADDTANPDWLAADLLAQAEHDEAAQSLLITPSQTIAKLTLQAVDSQLKTLPREEIARKSWAQNGAIIVVEDLDEASQLADKIAAEHLELCVRYPDQLANKIKHAGAIFLGHYTPEAVGDYVGGTNHVLPTARSARFASGLSVFDFLKRTSLLQCYKSQLDKIGPAAVTLAEAESLDAHARSIAMRLS
jgi:histidinol dehydrogenase